MILVVQDGLHTFNVDGTNLNIISAVSNIVQRYVFLYRDGLSDGKYAYILEIYKYGFKDRETENIECTVYYLV